MTCRVEGAPWQAKRSVAGLGLGCLLLGAALCCGGCSKEEEKTEPVAVAPPVREVDPLEDLDMDYRVQFAEACKPSTRELAEAIAKMASAIATGDEEGLKSVLAADDVPILVSLVNDGEWKSGTTNIEAVRVCVLEENEGTVKLGLGIQDKAGAYMLGWTGSQEGGSWVFKGLAIKPIEAARVAMLDGATLEEWVFDEGTPTVTVVEKPKDDGKDEEAEPTSLDEGGGGIDDGGGGGGEPPPSDFKKPPRN